MTEASARPRSIAASGPRAPGRPRDASLETRLPRAILEALAEVGPRALTVDLICRRVGIPRSTFYRRWPTLDAAIADAFDAACRVREIPDTGDVAVDLAAFTEDLLKLYADPIVGACGVFLSAEAMARPGTPGPLLATFPSRRAYNRRRIEAAIARGEIAPTVDPDLVVDLLSGLAMSRTLTGGAPLPRPVLTALIRRILGLAQPG